MFHVYPEVGYEETKIELAFDAVMCAYKYYCGGGDTVNGRMPASQGGRYDSGTRRALQVPRTPNTILAIARSMQTTPVEGTILSDRERHSRQVYRDRGRGRRRSHI